MQDVRVCGIFSRYAYFWGSETESKVDRKTFQRWNNYEYQKMFGTGEKEGGASWTGTGQMMDFQYGLMEKV